MDGRDWSCIYKLRDTKGCWQPPEGGREALNSSGASKSNQNCPHLDFRLLSPELWEKKCLFCEANWVVYCGSPKKPI